MCLLVTRTIYEKLVVSMISKELAIASRIKVERINLIYLFLVAIIVAVGIKEVGTLLVGALVIVPAAAAKNISSTLSRYCLHERYLRAGQCNIGCHLIKLRECSGRPPCRNRGRGYFCCRSCSKFPVKKTQESKEYSEHKYFNLNI